jgi:hypothetical protein
MATADAALHAAGVANSTSIPGGQPVLLWPNPPASGVVATFSDDDPSGAVGDYAATINWGDGATTSGVITAKTGGGFNVGGTHTYAALGTHPVSIAISDSGGSSTSASTQILTYALSGGGTFAIGDRTLPPSPGPVTFWGAQWSTANPMTGGPGSSSFKGFVNNPAAAACGAGSWSTNPGVSSNPPSSVPTYMSVLVTSRALQSSTSSSISGTRTAVVIVHTNSGYDSNAGGTGTGTVVAVICRS